jgi:hypothetical protein
MGGIRLLQNQLALLLELTSLTEVNSGGGHQARAGMVVIGVVPGEGGLYPTVCLRLAAKALGIGGLIFHRHRKAADHVSTQDIGRSGPLLPERADADRRLSRYQ